MEKVFRYESASADRFCRDGESPQAARRRIILDAGYGRLIAGKDDHFVEGVYDGLQRDGRIDPPRSDTKLQSPGGPSAIDDFETSFDDQMDQGEALKAKLANAYKVGRSFGRPYGSTVPDDTIAVDDRPMAQDPDIMSGGDDEETMDDVVEAHAQRLRDAHLTGRNARKGR